MISNSKLIAAATIGSLAFAAINHLNKKSALRRMAQLDREREEAANDKAMEYMVAASYAHRPGGS